MNKPNQKNDIIDSVFNLKSIRVKMKIFKMYHKKCYRVNKNGTMTINKLVLTPKYSLYCLKCRKKIKFFEIIYHLETND